MVRNKRRNQVEESSEEESSDNVEESDVDESDNGSGDSGSGGDTDSEDENNSDEATESEDEPQSPPKRAPKRKIAATSKTGRKRKQKKKDPNRPKNPMSAYMLYSNHRRPQVMADNPGMKFGEVTKYIAAQFRELDSSTRKKWDKRSMKDKQRFQREMANYTPPDDSTDSDDSDRVGKKKKRKKDPNAPKKALSSYMYFMNRNRARIKEANPDASFGDVARLVAAEFRSLTPDQKKIYEDLAAKDRLRYQKEMSKFVPAKGTKGKKFKDPNKPKRALTSFMCFSNATRAKVREEFPDLAFGDVGKKIGQMFRALTPKEKSKFEKMANKDKERYRREMDAYNKKQAGDDDSEEEEQSEDGSGSDSGGDASDGEEESEDGSGDENDSGSEEEQSEDDTEEDSE